EHGIPVLQPTGFRALRRPAVVERLRQVRAEIGLVAAYGRILPPEVLALAPRGFLNVHASLLPRWRGAWPMGAAILAGGEDSGGHDVGRQAAERAAGARRAGYG